MKYNIIILAGGFGTRLRSVVNDVPKPMADVNGKPFLEYLISHYKKQNIHKIILCVGYKKESIINYFYNNYKGIPIFYSKENTPLGTGGAIKQAIEYCNEINNTIIINGDTFLDINLENLRKVHYNNKNDITLALLKMENFDRYGSVKLKGNNIISFDEKQYCPLGFINGGVYMINNTIFDNFDLPNTFSFEEFLEKNIQKLKIGGNILEDSYFIDIGIPEDYQKAKIDFKALF